MAFLRTKWEATYQGATLTVVRNELTKGFSVLRAGRALASKDRSWFGLGTIKGEIDIGGRNLPITVTLSIGSKCKITIAGREIPVTKV